MDTNNLSYQLFLAEQVSEQAELEMFINECILISEGSNTITNIDVIHESFVDKIKESVKKFLQAIANMWHKFLEAMSTLLKTDKAYLEKYKDIILKKEHVKCDLNMYEYDKGIKVLLNSPIPLLNINSMDADLASDDTFIQKNFNQFIQGAKSPYVISDLAKAKFRGGSQEVKISSSHLNMTDLYNYCYGYKKLEELIGKDITNIQKSATDILLKVDKMVRDGQIKKESVISYEPSKYYSVVKESFVNEATPTRVADDNTSKPENNSTPGTGTTPEDKSKEGTSTPQQNKPGDAYQKSTGETDDNINTEKAAKELTEKANRYLKICGDFLGAKQSVAEEIYKGYMSIIRAHVRDHVGKKDALTNKGKDIGTDYTPKEKEVKDKLDEKKIAPDLSVSIINTVRNTEGADANKLIKFINDNDEKTITELSPEKVKEIVTPEKSTDNSTEQSSDEKPEGIISKIFNRKKNK